MKEFAQVCITDILHSEVMLDVKRSTSTILICSNSQSPLSVKFWLRKYSQFSFNNCHGPTQQPGANTRQPLACPSPFAPARQGGETEKRGSSWVDIKTV